MVTVGVPGTGTGLRLEGLRVVFDVERSVQSSLNSADVRVYNLAPDARQSIRENVSAFQVEAGYGDDVGQIFAGEVLRAEHHREGPDLVTYLDNAEGYDAVQNAEVTRTFSKGTPAISVLLGLAQAFDLPVDGVDARGTTGGVGGATLAAIQAELARLGVPLVLRRSMSFQGRVSDALNDLSFSWKRAFDWSIRQGSVCLLAKSAPAGGQAVRLTPASGLIGAPNKLEIVRSGTVKQKGRTGKTEKVEKVEVHDGAAFRCLLDHRLREGGLVVLADAEVEGAFRLERVAFHGDTHGGPFECECEAVALKGVAVA